MEWMITMMTYSQPASKEREENMQPKMESRGGEENLIGQICIFRCDSLSWNFWISKFVLTMPVLAAASADTLIKCTYEIYWLNFP